MEGGREGETLTKPDVGRYDKRRYDSDGGRHDSDRRGYDSDMTRMADLERLDLVHVRGQLGLERERERDRG